MKFTFSRGHYKILKFGNDSFVFKFPVKCKQNISKFTLILMKLMQTYVFYVLTT